MRKAMLVLALIGASVLFLGATPGTAGAANCTGYGFSAISYQGGHWWFTSQITYCTDVTGVRWLGSDSSYDSGIYDVTRNQNHLALGLTITALGQTSEYYSDLYTNVWGGGCGAGSFWVKPFVQFQVRCGSCGNTWGPVHKALQANQVNIC